MPKPQATTGPHESDPNVVYYGPGLHEVSTINLTRGKTLYAAEGAVLRVVLPEEEMPLVESDWAGQRMYQDTITALDTSDITICDRGIIDLSMLT